MNAIAKAKETESNAPTERIDSLRIVIHAGFVHNRTNIIGSSMASYLTRNESRFLFSHEFAFIPLKDLVNILQNGKSTSITLKTWNGKRYQDIFAMNYLCRPSVLETMNPFKFYVEYESTYNIASNNDESELLEFEDNQMFNHPSHIEDNQGQIKKIKALRKKRKIFAMDFAESISRHSKFWK